MTSRVITITDARPQFSGWDAWLSQNAVPIICVLCAAMVVLWALETRE
jgi:hypothetical protein